jgi:DNA-binding PucR family transcriptional regulator
VEPAARDAVYVVPADPGRGPHARVLASAAADLGGTVDVQSGWPAAVVPTDDLDRTGRAIHRDLVRATGAPQLVCGTRPGRAGVGAARALAVRCARFAPRLGISEGFLPTAALGAYAILLDPERDDDVRAFVRDTLGPLLDHDSARGTDLVTTLDAYVTCARNTTRTAAALHLHINTLLKRLARIETVLGPDWKDPARLLQLEFAVKLARFPEASG